MRLDEYDEIEWRDVCRRVRPDITDEQFAEAWAEFVAIKSALSSKGMTNG